MDGDPKPDDPSASDMSDESPPEEPNHLEVLSNQFNARIEGFRELLEVISPHVAALDQPAGIEHAIEKSGLSTHGKDIVRDIFIGTDDQDDDSLETPENGSGTTEEDAPEDSGLTDEFAELARNEPSGLVRVIRRFSQGIVAPRSSLLHGSLLTVAVASFEFLLAGLYGEHLIQFPNQLDDDEKEFSLADLTEIGSIEEAQSLLAERRVDSFMRRSVEDWSKWSKRTLGFSFEDLCLDYIRFNEVLQRRHVVVHNGGIVNRLYLERTDLPDDERPSEGDELQISSAYMGAALDELEALGYGLAALAWAKWDDDGADEASIFLNVRIYDLLKNERFRLAKKLAEVGEELEQADNLRWMIKVNGWIASKRAGGLDTCRDAIADWDVSALSGEFKLAKACLLEESDEALDLLAVVIKENEPSTRRAEVWDWPLLDTLREDSRFEQVFVDAGYSPPSRQRQGGGDSDPVPSRRPTGD